MTLSVAVAQFAPGTDVAANLATIEQLVTAAADQGAELVVLPEYSSYSEAPVGERFAAHAEALDGPFTTAVIALAGRLRVTIVLGLVEAAGERFRNTAVAVDGSGVRAVYRKTHLYDAFGAHESRWVEPGALEAPQTFEVGGLRVGLQTCYDLRFPEVSRRLADAGVDVVVVPADWVPGPLKLAHWRTLLAARAIENTAYVVASGQVPPDGIGASTVLAPDGQVLAELGEAVGVAVAQLDAERIAAVRRTNPSLELRRYAVVPRTDDVSPSRA